LPRRIAVSQHQRQPERPAGGTNRQDLPGAAIARWKEHNPYDLATQLKHIPLFISAGDGQPGPLDDRGAALDSIESSINAQNKEFVKQLRAVGANAKIALYGHGTHNWTYWQRELHRSWPLLTDKLESPSADPTAPIHVSRADLLRRSGRAREAKAAAYQGAVELVTNPVERRYLLERVAEV
jgi:hypothetical protein